MSKLSLDVIDIKEPCPADWSEMVGDDRARHCAICDLNVYDLSAMSRREAEAFIEDVEGRVCARLYRRPDGKVMTAECPNPIQKSVRWVGKKTAVAAGVLLLILMNVVAYATRDHWAPVETRNDVASTVEDVPLIGYWLATKIRPTQPPPIVLMGDISFTPPPPTAGPDDTAEKRPD